MPIFRTIRSDLRKGPILGASLVGLLAGGAAGVPVNHDVYTYMWRDDRFCNDCHVHDYANEAYDRSLHAKVATCHDCHLVPIRHYPRNLWLTLFDPPQGPEDIHPPAVESVLCAACHSAELAEHPLTGPMPDALRAQVVKIDHSTLHRKHLESDTRRPHPGQGGKADTVDEDAGAPSAHGGHAAERASWDKGVIRCVDCHGSEDNRAHHFPAERGNCVHCHDDPVFTADMADGDAAAPHGLSSLECRECHFSGFMGETPAVND